MPQSSDPEIKFECVDCHQLFDTPRALAAHRKTHGAGIRCPECGETVRYLMPHINRKHGGDPEEALVGNLKALVKEVKHLRATVTDLEAELVGVRQILDDHRL